MKHLIILLSFLTWFFSLFAQQDTSITVRGYSTQGQGKLFVKRDSMITVRGYKIQAQKLKLDTLFKVNGQKYKTYQYNGEYNQAYSLRDNVINLYNNDTLSKEITTEVPCNADATIFIENLNRKLIIKTSPDNKVKIRTTVNYNADSKLTDAEWFQKLNLELKSNNNQVVLKSDNINGTHGLRSITITGRGISSSSTSLQGNINNLNKLNNNENVLKSINGQNPSSGATTLQHYNLDSVSNPNSVAAFIGDGNWVIGKSITQPMLTIYIPVGAKLDVESKYADVEIQNDLKNIKADITNASFSFKNVDNVDLQGKYARVNAGNIKKADVELSNGKFYAKDIYSAKFDSKYSNIEFGVTNDLKIESNNDQYEIDEVTDLKANKNYGNIRITNLKNSFTLTGNNADIKIRDIAAGVSNIKIDDKYADIRLPLDNIANYSVDFDGKNCNVYAPFEKIPVIKIEEVKPKDLQLKEPPTAKEPTTKKIDEIRIGGFKTLSPLTITRDGALMNAKDNAFKASVGDVKSKHAELQLKCTNCTVDFK